MIQINDHLTIDVLSFSRKSASKSTSILGTKKRTHTYAYRSDIFTKLWAQERRTRNRGISRQALPQYLHKALHNKKTRSTLKKPFIFSPTIYNLKIICYKTIIFSFFILKLFSRNWVEDVIYFKFVWFVLRFFVRLKWAKHNRILIQKINTQNWINSPGFKARPAIFRPLLDTSTADLFTRTFMLGLHPRLTSYSGNRSTSKKDNFTIFRPTAVKLFSTKLKT